MASFPQPVDPLHAFAMAYRRALSAGRRPLSYLGMPYRKSRVLARIAARNAARKVRKEERTERRYQRWSDNWVKRKLDKCIAFLRPSA
jgi:hypothetical protein